MIASNQQFKSQTLEALTGFISTPQNRTADVVSDITVLTTQAFCWSKLPED